MAVDNVITFLRRASPGAGGAPSVLASGQPAWNDNDQILYIGFGDDGGGLATSKPAIAGPGAYMTIFDLDQTVDGIKTFVQFPLTPSSPPVNDYDVANKKFVVDSMASAGAGDVVGPAGATADNVVVFNGTTGKIIKDGFPVSTYAKTFLDDANEAAFKATVNLEPGVDIQTYSAKLAAIAALGVTDGTMIVGDGTTFVAESGATLRSSIGVGTSDTPQFTGIEIGHATDTTLARMSSGKLSVEGVEILTVAGGTMTGALTLNADPSSALHAATKQYVDAAVLNVGLREVVRVATTANIAISTALNSGDTIDGVTLANGELVLVKSQTAPAENGVYVVGAVPARATQFDTWAELVGSTIVVAEGTANADSMWLCTANAGGTLNTTAVTYSQMIVTGELKAANNLSDLANAGTARTNLGLGTMAIQNAASVAITGGTISGVTLSNCIIPGGTF